MERLLLVINPYAGKQHCKEMLFELVDICTRRGFETTVLPTRERGQTADMVRERAALYERVLCCGGDGTLNEVISGLMACPVETRPPLGFIPAGTTNDLAVSLGIDKEPVAACEGIFSGGEVLHDVGQFNGGRYFSYVAAFGAFTEVSYQTSQSLKNALGHFAYVLEGTMRLSELHPRHLRMRWDEGELEGDFLFGAVCNTHSVGGLLHFSEKEADLSDGLFELLLIRMPRNIADLRRTLAELHSRIPEEGLVFLHTREAAFDFEDETAWALDGEDGGAHRHVEIVNHRGAVRFLCRRAPKEEVALL